jgi:hypothetical protein
MELYPAVKPEMSKLEAEKDAKEDARLTTDAERAAAKKRRQKAAEEDAKLDAEQLAAGKTYLKLYTEALTAAESASAANLRQRGEEAQDAGYRIWSSARVAEPRTKMWSWIMWELPARCETAARRLKERASLLSGVLKPQVEAPADAAPRETAAAAPPPAEPGTPAALDPSLRPSANPDGAGAPFAVRPGLGDAPSTTPDASSPADAPPADAPPIAASKSDAPKPDAEPAKTDPAPAPAAPASDPPKT